MKKQRLALLLASVWMAAGLAHAESYVNPSWYVLPQVGAVIPDSEIEASTGVFGGVKLGKQISERLDTQIGVTFTSLDEDSDGYSSGSYKQGTLSIEALYLFSRSALRPFVSAGIGVSQDKLSYTGIAPNADGDASEVSLLGSIGAGLQYSWSKTAFLQADVKYVVSTPDYNNGSTIDLPKIANIYAGIGAGFHFGQPPAPVPVAEPVEPAPAPIVAVAGLNVCEDTGSCKKPEVAPAPAPVVKPVAPAPAPKAKVLSKTLRSDASFASGSSVLTKKGKKSIDAAIAAEGLTYATLSKLPDLELLIVGHASRTGSEAFNQKISLARAESVKKYLVSKGIAAESIKTAGRGSSEPITKPDDCKKLKGKKLSACLSTDRRVELFAQASVPAK